MLCKSCRSSHADHNKIGFAFFEFFCDLLWNLQDPAKTLKGVRSILRLDPWNFSNHTTLPLTLTVRPPEYKILHRHAPDGGGEVAAGDVGPAQANKWHRVEIGLTLSQLVAVDWPEMSPASGGGGSVVARPRALDLRRGQGRGWTMRGTIASLWPSGGPGRAGWLGVPARSGARRRPRELVLRRAGGSAKATCARLGSRCVRREVRCKPTTSWTHEAGAHRGGTYGGRRPARCSRAWRKEGAFMAGSRRLRR
jgi:hypothetical protein